MALEGWTIVHTTERCDIVNSKHMGGSQRATENLPKFLGFGIFHPKSYELASFRCSQPRNGICRPLSRVDECNSVDDTAFMMLSNLRRNPSAAEP